MVLGLTDMLLTDLRFVVKSGELTGLVQIPNRLPCRS